MFVKETSAQSFFCHFATYVQLEGIASSERESMLNRSSRSSFCLSVVGAHASVIAFYTYHSNTFSTSVTRIWTVSHSISTFLAYISVSESSQTRFATTFASKTPTCFVSAITFSLKHYNTHWIDLYLMLLEVATLLRVGIGMKDTDSLPYRI